MNKKPKYTSEELLQDLYLAKLKYPEVATTRSILYTGHCIKTYLRHFKNIAALDKQMQMKYGLNITSKPVIQWTPEIIKNEFRRLEQKLGRRPYLKEFVELSFYKNIAEAVKNIYRTYSNLVANMGYIPERYRYTDETREYDQKCLVRILKKVSKEQDTTKWETIDFYTACHTTSNKISYLFGNIKNWFNAAKINIPQKVKCRLGNYTAISDEEILKSIKKVAQDLKKIPTYREYNHNSKKLVSACYIAKRFGSWNNATNLAKLKPNTEYNKTIFNKEKTIKEILRIKKLIGHIPTTREFNKYRKNTISSNRIITLIGSWNNALKAAGLK